MRRSFLFIVWLTIAGGLLRDTSAQVPADFTLRARFFPGGGLVDYKDSEPWRLRITANGKAIQETWIIGSPRYPNGVSKSFTLSQQQLSRLVKAVQEAAFFSLPEEISKTDGDHFAGCVLAIQMRGQSRTVKFVWPTDEKGTHNRPALTRFWKVWRAVLKAVPSPNHNSEAVWWLQHVRPDLVGQPSR